MLKFFNKKKRIDPKTFMFYIETQNQIQRQIRHLF